MALTQLPGKQIGPLDLTTEVTGVLPVANGGTGGISQTGMPIPVQAHANGSETYTIVSGSVTQIAGTTIQSGTYTPSVGDRILIPCAPASTGVGTTNSSSAQPANGIYVVTSNTTNLSLSRATDMSGSINPAGLTVFSEYPSLSWVPQSIWTAITPSSAAAFTYGTGAISFQVSAGFNISPTSIYINSGQLLMGGTSSGYTVLQSAAVAASPTTLTLPAGTAVIDGEQFITLTSPYTLTSQTAAQKLFNASTNGAVTLPVGTYFFECFFTLSAMSTASSVSNYFGFALTAGTATISGQLWQAEGNKAVLATAATPVNSVNTAANVNIATTGAANTSAVGWAQLLGKLRISVAGTVIPQVSLGVAAAAVVGVDSYFRIWNVGSNTVTNVGNWS